MTAQSSGTQVCAPLLIYMVAGSYWCPSLLAGGLRVDPRAQEPGIAVTMTDAFKQSGCYPAMAWGAAKDKRSEGLVHGLKAVHHSRSTRGLQPHGTSWAAGLHCRNSSRGAGCDRPRQVRWCAAGIGTLGSELARLKRMQRRRGGALALLRTSRQFGRNPEVAPPDGDAYRARDRYRTAQGVRAVHTRWSEARLGALEK
eukprot:scaffold27385_cov36-Phaeocystis_antarctica.AAC.2